MAHESGVLQGYEMNDEAIDEFLTEQGVGVLSMSTDGTPYGIPLSFGYDGDDRLYFDEWSGRENAPR